jgi:hypothetical protein
VGHPRGEHARQIIDGDVCGDRALREHLRRREHDAVPALARIAAHLAQLECGRGDERDEGVRPRVDRVDTEDREVVGLPPVVGFDGKRERPTLGVGAAERRRQIDHIERGRAVGEIALRGRRERVIQEQPPGATPWSVSGPTVPVSWKEPPGPAAAANIPPYASVALFTISRRARVERVYEGMWLAGVPEG